MRNAYVLLGSAFLVLFVGAYMLMREVGAPTSNIESLPLAQPNEVISSSQESMSLSLTSSSFADGGSIPSKFTCEGENINPELLITGVPEGTKSLVLVMDDPDIPESVKEARGIEKFDHWVVYNIAPETTVIAENSIPGTEGLNSRGAPGFVGSCPPDREHRYIYRLYALSGTLNFVTTPSLDEVEAAAKGVALAEATLMGRYEKMNK